MSEKLSNGLVDMEFGTVSKPEVTEITIKNWVSSEGRLSLTYKKTFAPTGGGETYETVYGKGKTVIVYALKLECGTTEVFSKDYSDLIEASNGFNSLFKTLHPTTA